jgi:hypothetical protein
VQVAAEIVAAGGQAVALQGDVTAEHFPVRVGSSGCHLHRAPHMGRDTRRHSSSTGTVVL